MLFALVDADGDAVEGEHQPVGRAVGHGLFGLDDALGEGVDVAGIVGREAAEAHAVFGCSTCNALAASAVGEVEQARMVQSASGRSIPDPAQIAPIFGSLKRGFCRDPGTSCTNVPMNEALTTVAAWYYRNVELPARGGSSSGSSSRSGSSSTSRAVAHAEPATASGFMGAGKPFYQRPVVWTGIGVVVLLIGGVAFWPKKD